MKTIDKAEASVARRRLLAWVGWGSFAAFWGSSAPVPLYRAAIAIDLGGNIIVDKSQQENRTGPRDRPPFFLPLHGTGQSAV